MIHWDREMKRLKVRARLRALPPRVQVAFAAGCLEHALEVALTPKGRKSKYAAVVREAIAASRHDAEGRPEISEVSLRGLAERIVDLLPHEDDSPPAGCADLLDGALGLCRLLQKPKADAAFSIASYAYQAVSDRFIDAEDSAGGEAEYTKAELATAECLEEVRVQVAVLERLEGTEHRR